MTNCLYVDDTFLVVEKQANLLCVPGRGEDKQDCLIHRLHREYPEALIVHRLDMATSGLLLVARNKDSQRALSRQFERRQVEKRYLAVVCGVMEQQSGVIDLPLQADWPNRPRQKVDYIHGKSAQTQYRVISTNAHLDSTVMELCPITGRTHQLRVHLQAIGHPIVGDALYGGGCDTRQKSHRLLLHASHLSFTHPANARQMSFQSQASFLSVSAIP